MLPAPSPVLRLRLAALGTLWRCRASWQLPAPRALMQRERDHALAAMMPAIVVLACIVGLGLFVTLPMTLADAYGTALAALWPAWVTQAAPLVAALMLALQRMPALALAMQQRQQRGEFEALAAVNANPAVYPCVPMLVAHAVVGGAASMLLTACTLVAGFIAALAAGVGDLGNTLEAVFILVSPVDLLRGLGSGVVLGLLCSLSTVLHVWPGTQGATHGLQAHRLGMRTMLLSALVVFAAALVMNRITGWLMAAAT